MILKIDSGGNKYYLAYLHVNTPSSFKKLAEIPKLDLSSHQPYERFRINRTVNTLMFLSQSESNPDLVQVKLLALTKGQNFLKIYDLPIEKKKTEIPDTYFEFCKNTDLMEFNTETKTGLLHKINLWMITSSVNIKIPFSWSDSTILMIKVPPGHRICLVYIEDAGQRSLIMAELRPIGENLMFIAMHSTRYGPTEDIWEVRMKQLGKQFNFLVAIRLGDHLEVVNYIMTQYTLKDKRMVIQASHDLYKLIFIKGYFFMIFRDGSLSHVNHTHFFKFKLKEQ